MNHDDKQFSACETGADFWRDTALNHGADEAVAICGDYLDMNLKREHTDDERQFCRGLFSAMYEAAAGRADTAKILYPYSFEESDKRLEASHYHESRRLNGECARAIDAAIHDSCYKLYHYNLENAAWKVILDYGFNRVNVVLAHHIQEHEWDGRYSRANIEWAKNIAFHSKAFGGTYIDAHATLVDDYTNYVRKLYVSLGAERFSLPGREEHGESVHGYEIIRAITFNTDRGFAIGHNPDAADTFVCWQFTVSDGSRDYYWGTYGEERTTADNYTARVFVHMRNNNAVEIQSPVTAA